MVYIEIKLKQPSEKLPNPQPAMQNNENTPVLWDDGQPRPKSTNRFRHSAHSRHSAKNHVVDKSTG